MNAIVPHLMPLQVNYLADFDLSITCGICASVGTVRMEKLAEAHGNTTELHEVISRLRCSTCGTAPSGVSLRAQGEPVGIALIE